MLLVDVRDGRAQSVQGQLTLGAAVQSREGAGGAVEGEFQQQQLETSTAPVQSMEELEDEVRRWRSEAADAARQARCQVAALGTSPLPAGPIPVESERFSWIREQYQLMAREQLNCGLHMHVSVDGPEEGIGVLDRVRVWLPTILALSANSPFIQGEETGFASWRSQMMGRWPSSGASEVFGSVDSYTQLVEAMVGSGVLLDEGMVYFDARLSTSYPTVEIRVADVVPRVEDAVLLATLCRAMVETAAREWADGKQAPQVPAALVRLASFQASRHGMTGDLLDPLTTRPRPAREVVDALLTWVRPALQASEDLARVESALEVLHREGTGADLQRRTLDRTGQFVDVVAQAVRVTAGQE